MALSLKVFLESSGQMKTMRFMHDMSVSEVAAEIREKYNIGGEDHGIFQPEVSGKSAGRWLRMDRTLQYYDLNTGDEIRYKKKHRPLKVRLVDGTIKTIAVDESLNIQEIAESIGKKMSVGNPEEYSLKVEGSGDREWLTPTLSLHENNVTEDMVLVFKKKFFFNDANIDRGDPVQLHLVYVQSRDAIIQGTHPTQKDEAVKLAAMQCQAEFGTFDPSKHKSANLKVKDLLPPQWVKKKGIAQAVLKEYRKLANTDSENAKYRYIQMCRALKTYGITTFEVQQKIEKPGQKKPKFKKLILGVTRDSLVLMNADTKEIEKSFPLTHLKRWAPGARTFTLDFGEYEEDYFTVQTLEGEAISQLIAGYIDIILKRTKDAPRIAMNSESKVAEEISVAPIQAQATAFTTAPTAIDVITPQVVTESMISPGMMMPAMQEAQLHSLEGAISDLGKYMGTLHHNSVPPAGFDPQYAREHFAMQSQGILTKGAQLIGALASGQVSIDDLAGELSNDIADLIANAKFLASSAAQDVSLIPGAMAVSEAISRLLQCAKDVRDNPNDKQAQMALKIAKTGLAAANLYLKASQQGTFVPDGNKDLILASAHAVAAATDQLIAQSITYADGNPKLVAVTNYAKTLGDGVLYSATTLAPTMCHPECQQQVNSLASTLAKSCAGLLQAFQSEGCDPSYLANLNAAVKSVTDAVSQLMKCSTGAPNGSSPLLGIMEAGDQIRTQAGVLVQPSTGPAEILASYKAVAGSTSALVNNTKLVAEANPDLQNALLSAAKRLALATRGLVQTVQSTCKAPGDQTQRAQLQQGSRAVVAGVDEISASLATELAFERLSQAAVLLASKSTDLVAASARCEVEDARTYANLSGSAQTARLEVIKLVGAVATLATAPQDPQNQGGLVAAAKGAAHPTSQLVAVSKSSLKKVDDGEQRKDLADAADAAGSALQQLMDACQAVEEIGGGKEIKEALEEFENMAADLDAQLMAADGGFLMAPIGESLQEAINVLKFAVEELSQSSATLTDKATTDPGSVGENAAKFLAQVQAVVGGAKSVAGLTKGKESQKMILTSAKELTKKSTALLGSTKKVVMSPSDAALVPPMTTSKQALDAEGVTLMNAARGINTAEIEASVASVQAQAGTYRLGRSTAFSQHIAELKQHVQRIGATSSQVVSAAMSNPKALGQASSMAAKAHAPLVEATGAAAAGFSDAETQEGILSAGRAVTKALAALLEEARNAAGKNDPQSTELRHAHGAMNERLKELVNAVKPGQVELGEAYDIISQAVAVLDSKDEPLKIDPMPLWRLNEVVRRIALNTGTIMEAGRHQSPDLGPKAKATAGQVRELVDAARLAGNPQQNPCTILADKISAEATKLAANSANRTSVIGGTKAIATLTKEAMAAAKESRGDADTQQKVVKASQLVGAGTAALGKAAKALLTGAAGATEQVQKAALAVQQRAAGLRDLATNKEAKPVSDLVIMDLFNSTRSVATATSQLISAASVVADDPAVASSNADLSTAATSLLNAIAEVRKTSSALAPGAKEITDALRALQMASAELDNAGISIAAGVDVSSKKPVGRSIQQIHESLVGEIRDLAAQTQNLVKSVVETPEGIAATVAALQKISVGTGSLSLDVAYSTTDASAQKRQINGGKAVLGAVIDLLTKARAASVNPNDDDLLNDLSAAAQGVKDSITVLGGELQGGMLVLKECDEALAAIAAAEASVTSPLARDGTKTYQDCQKAIKDSTRLLANGLSQLVQTSSKNPDQIGVSCKELSLLLQGLVTSTRQAAGVTRQAPVQQGLLQAGKGVCSSATEMVANAKKVAENSSDAHARASVSQCLGKVTNAVSGLLTAVKRGALAEREIEEAAEKVAATKADLDQAALFAASGQFNANVAQGRNVENAFTDLRKVIKLSEQDNKNIVDAAKGFQEQVAQVAKLMAEHVSQVSFHSKEMASLLPDLMAQQSVLTGARAVSIAAQSVILAGKDSQANPLDTEAQKSLASSREAFTAALARLTELSSEGSTELIKTIRELQTVLDALAVALKNYISPSYTGTAGAQPAAIVDSARNVAKNNGALLSTFGSDQDGFIAAVKAVGIDAVNLVDLTKGSRRLTNNPAVLTPLDSSLQGVVHALSGLLESGKLQRVDDPAFYKAFSDKSEACTAQIHDLVTAVKALPGGEGLSLETDIGNEAETELQAAIAAIEAAKARLLDPATYTVVEGALDLGDVAQQIVAATMAVATATQNLVITATDVQNEIVAQGRATSKKLGQVYKKDPAWQEGLISAARAVAGSTEDLVTYANECVKGESGEEMLVACVRGVGGATARLVSAAKAKADPFSPAHQSLGKCAKDVALATQGLANATKAATDKKVEAEISSRKTTTSFAGLRAKELEEQARIAKLELELERARQNLFQKRRKDYGN